jgi:hypothetical protein
LDSGNSHSSNALLFTEGATYSSLLLSSNPLHLFSSCVPSSACMFLLVLTVLLVVCCRCCIPAVVRWFQCLPLMNPMGLRTCSFYLRGGDRLPACPPLMVCTLGGTRGSRLRRARLLHNRQISIQLVDFAGQRRRVQRSDQTSSLHAAPRRQPRLTKSNNWRPHTRTASHRAWFSLPLCVFS